MSTVEEDDRRSLYRVSPESDQVPVVSVNDGEVEAVPDCVADINARGAKLEFQRQVAGGFRPGGTVSISITLPALEEPAEIPARTVFSLLQEQQMITAFVFIELPESLYQAGGDVFALLNRRKNRRTPSEGELRASLNFNRHSWRDAEAPISIQDLSSSGMAFEVDESSGARFRVGDRFDLVMNSNTENEARRFTAVIRRRTSDDGKSRYGCELTEAE